MKLLNSLQDSQYKAQVYDSFYLFIFNGMNQLLPLVVIPYLMVVLGAEGYGYIGFATALCNYFVLIVDFGFNLSATKAVAIAFEKKNQEELSRIFYSTLLSKLLLLLLSIVLYIPICFGIPQFRSYSITTLCMFPLVLSNVFTFAWLYQGIGKIKILSVINTVVKFLILPLIFILVKSNSDYNIAALIQSGVYLAGAAVSTILIRKYVSIRFVRIKWSDIKKSIKESWPLFLSSVATSVYTQLFTLILAYFSPAIVVGKYSAAERIMRSCCFMIYSPISQAFYPKVAALGSVDMQKAKMLLNKLFSGVLLVMTMLAICFLLFADVISDFLGKGYEDISTLLRIIALTPIPIALGGIAGQMGLIALGNDTSKMHFIGAYWKSVMISLPVVCILTYMFNEIGTAVSMMLTEFIVFFFMAFYYKKDSKCY